MGITKNEYIEKHGEIAYDVWIKKRGKAISRGRLKKNTNTLEHWIVVFGKEEALKRWNAKTKKILKSREKYTKEEWDKICKKCGHTLKGYIEKYGEIEGTKKYNKYKENNSPNYKNFIKKHGEVEGTKKWDEFKKSRSRSLKGFINLYGEVEGTKKYNKFKNNSKKSNSLDGYIEKYGEVEGTKRWNNKNSKIGVSLDRYIEKYGEVEGTKKWNLYCRNRKTQLSKQNFIRIYGEVEGKRRFENYRKNNKFSNSLEGYIEKYGKVEGTKKWISKQKKWVSSISGYSKISQLLFFQLLENIDDKENVYFAEYNGEKYLNHYYIDFCYHNKIIEFNGDIWHANPNLFEEWMKPNPFNNLTSKELWNKDNKKYDFLRQAGYKILVVWENDYNNNFNKIIQECLIFLKGGDA